jgi:hypothetical protein
MPTDNSLQNAYMATLFGSFVDESLSGLEKFVCNSCGNPNSPQADKLSFPNLYKLHYLYILMDFYLVLMRRVCSQYSQPDDRSVKRPLICLRGWLRTRSLQMPFWIYGCFRCISELNVRPLVLLLHILGKLLSPNHSKSWYWDSLLDLFCWQ